MLHEHRNLLPDTEGQAHKNQCRMNTSLDSSLLVRQQGGGGKTSGQGVTGIIGPPPNLPGFHLFIDAYSS